MASATKLGMKRIRNHLRAHKPRKKGQINGEINVTPLIDVVLVLLIIFMVVTPMITSGVPVDLPKTSYHDRKPDDGKDIIVSITKDGDFYVGKARVRADELQKAVEEEKRRNPEKSFFVKGDNRSTWGAARTVMETLNKAGFTDVMLGTDENKSLTPGH